MPGGSRALVGLLSEPARLRVLGAVALGATTATEVVQATGLDPREVASALRRLQSGGLVSAGKGELLLHEELFKEAARAEAPPSPPDEELSADPATAAVLRAFLRGGRITDYPVQRSKLMLLLGHVAAVFEPGVRYAERDVNAMMRAWHDDYARLRRLLVDAGFLDRKDNVYWRIGGWVDTAGPTSTGATSTGETSTGATSTGATSTGPTSTGPTSTGATSTGPTTTGRAPTEPAAATGRPVRRQQRIASYGLAERDGEVLLTRLCRGVHRGRWTLPGGGLDFGERPAAALVREVREETGYSVRVGELLDVDAELLEFERDGERVQAHPVRILYRVVVLGGTLGVLELDGSTDEAAWWPRSALPDTLTPYAAEVLATGRLSAR